MNEVRHETTDWQDALNFFTSRLFRDVQMAGLFKDSKTFADAIGKQPLPTICALYESQVDNADFNLREFVDEHFDVPTEIELKATQHEHVDFYIQSMWRILQRKPDTQQWDSLIPLQHDYLVPGGRFREIYYWDSYFTAVGLISSGYPAQAVSMLDNFLTLQQQVGCIPNGNRAYYHTRSQPPVLVLLYDLVAGYLAPADNARALAGLSAEYQFWMQNRSVQMPDGSILNRYYDADATPRSESYREDVNATAHLNEDDARTMLRHIRAACESGWDFSSRWFADPTDFATLKTTDIVPIDLNALLYYLEVRLSEVAETSLDRVRYAQAAEQRKATINRYMYDETAGFFFDFDLAEQHKTSVWSLASALPLYVGLAERNQAAVVAGSLHEKFLRPGGLVTTLNTTDQQWDSPNGWAPLQWFAARGLQRYGYSALAEEVMSRWVQLVQDYYQEHHVVLEKYDVCNTSKRATGGEYEVQLGFGWTNGVYHAFQKLLSE